MNPQERDMLTKLLDGLVAASVGRKDAEADELIRRAAARQPEAVYLLVQRTLLQEVALRNAQARIEALTRELDAARSSAPAGGGSFLGGGWGSDDTRAIPGNQPGALAAGLGRAPAGGAFGGAGAFGGGAGNAWRAQGQPSAFSGFLGSALATAAGVAGGALLFQGIQGLFTDEHGHPTTDPASLPGLAPGGELLVQDVVGQGVPDLGSGDSLFGDGGGWADGGDFSDGGDSWV